jgi:hypothetical protein
MNNKSLTPISCVSFLSPTAIRSSGSAAVGVQVAVLALVHRVRGRARERMALSLFMVGCWVGMHVHSKTIIQTISL